MACGVNVDFLGGFGWTKWKWSHDCHICVFKTRIGSSDDFFHLFNLPKVLIFNLLNETLLTFIINFFLLFFSFFFRCLFKMLVLLYYLKNIVWSKRDFQVWLCFQRLHARIGSPFANIFNSYIMIDKVNILVFLLW